MDPSIDFLFPIFINGLPGKIISSLSIYVDGRAIYACIHSTSERFDEIKLTADLEN